MSKNFWQQLPRPILALAPMVGITDSAFRRLAKYWGADVVYSEMIASEALIRLAPKALKMMEFEAVEQPLVVQIMGNNPHVIAKAAKMVEATGAAGLDLNFGCPANKIARNFCGVMLMRDLDRARQVIEAATSAVSIPVSIKVRISINKSAERLPGGKREVVSIMDFLQKIHDLPVAAIMIHGRSFEGSFSGPIDLEVIKEVKRIFTHGPVLANGGLETIESSKNILQTTGVDGLGLARSVLGKPWLFKQLREYLTTGQYQPISWQEIKQSMQLHTDWFYDFYGPKMFQPMRRHLAHYIKGQEQAGALRKQLVLVNSPDEVKTILQRI